MLPMLSLEAPDRLHCKTTKYISTFIPKGLSSRLVLQTFSQRAIVSASFATTCFRVSAGNPRSCTFPADCTVYEIFDMQAFVSFIQSVLSQVGY